jgi:hypothetical protein
VDLAAEVANLEVVQLVQFVEIHQFADVVGALLYTVYLCRDVGFLPKSYLDDKGL